MAGRQSEERRDLADVTAQLAALQQMTTGELQARYRELYGEPTRSRNKRYLQKRLAWQIQANAEGGLSQRALDRIEELAPLAPVRWRQPISEGTAGQGRAEANSAAPDRDPRLPAPGSVITRTYKGAAYQTTVLEDGFEYQGQRYRSLSKIAREITGTNWNGFLFWGLQKRRQAAGGAA